MYREGPRVPEPPQSAVGIPSREEMALSREYRDRIVGQLAEWVKDPTLPDEARYVTLQIFDLVGFDYPATVSDIANLFDSNLVQTANGSYRFEGDTLLKLNFLRDINSHGYYECLTDLLLRRSLSFGDTSGRDAIISTYLNNPKAREGIAKWLGQRDADKYIEQNPQLIHVIFDRLNEQIINGSQDIAEAVIKLFDDRTYFRKDKYARDLLLGNLDKVPAERKALLFESLVKMVRNHRQWVDAEETIQRTQDLTGTPYEYIQEGSEGEYKKNREFGQETVRLVADKMWGFMDSTDLKEQFWAVYTLNLYNEAGEKFREVVDRLLLATHTLEQAVPGSTKTLDKIRDRLSK